mmetsp:Transcript_20923/g.42476  ORF Transcript_20923/g.42476 Transcript_20923/m.42476 type:complete len:247 (-) Transcript_20923:572-1312(-)
MTTTPTPPASTTAVTISTAPSASKSIGPRTALTSSRPPPCSRSARSARPALTPPWPSLQPACFAATCRSKASLSGWERRPALPPRCLPRAWRTGAATGSSCSLCSGAATTPRSSGRSSRRPSLTSTSSTTATCGPGGSTPGTSGRRRRRAGRRSSLCLRRSSCSLSSISTRTSSVAAPSRRHACFSRPSEAPAQGWQPPSSRSRCRRRRSWPLPSPSQKTTSPSSTSRCSSHKRRRASTRRLSSVV